MEFEISIIAHAVSLSIMKACYNWFYFVMSCNDYHINKILEIDDTYT